MGTEKSKNSGWMMLLGMEIGIGVSAAGGSPKYFPLMAVTRIRITFRIGCPGIHSNGPVYKYQTVSN